MLPIQSLKKVFAVVTLMMFSIVACRKELPQAHDPENRYASTFSDVFDNFWNTMNSRYQFWDRDTTDWDAMYTRYQPLFAKLDINNEDDQRKSVHYFKAMLSGTLDGHMFLNFTPPAIYDSSVYPRVTQNELTIQRVQIINPLLLPGEAERATNWYYFPYYDIDAANYLDTGSISGVYSDPDYGDVTVLGGTIRKNILYLGFDSEFLTLAIRDKGTNALKSAYTAFSQALQNNPNVKGAIVDMRSSLGGFANDAVLLASSMIDKPIMRGKVRYKNGTGRLDYTPWTPSYINPATGAKAIKVPLIILTDVLTFSGAESVTAALRAIHGAAIVGTATRGGITGNGAVNSIQGKGATTFQTLKLGNFMEMIMSSCSFRMPDGSETIWGIKPDYVVPFDTTAILAGKDPQLEKALLLIH